MYWQNQKGRIILIATTRILEIGGGERMNLSPTALAFPNAQFFNFYLARSVVENGQRLGIAADFSYFGCEAGDIMTTHERNAPGSYDYAVVHGVYA
jgi:hypothetical protein